MRARFSGILDCATNPAASSPGVVTVQLSSAQQPADAPTYRCVGPSKLGNKAPQPGQGDNTANFLRPTFELSGERRSGPAAGAFGRAFPIDHRIHGAVRSCPNTSAFMSPRTRKLSTNRYALRNSAPLKNFMIPRASRSLPIILWYCVSCFLASLWKNSMLYLLKDFHKVTRIGANSHTVAWLSPH